MDQLQLDYLEARKDAKKSLIYTTIALFLALLLTFLIKFDVRPEALVDTPPFKSDEVIEEFQVELTKEELAGGSRGGGTPGSGRIAPPADQTERVATAAQSDFSHSSGNSDNHNASNSNNTSSTTSRVTDPFSGSGGSGGRNGSGNGPFSGPGSGTGTNDGVGPGHGSGRGRVRLNSVNQPNYNLDYDCRIGFLLQVDENGMVVGVRTIKSVTTCSDLQIINDLKERCRREVRYNKDPGSPIVEMNYTFNLNSRN
ncbi:MAG: hypothetical protein RLZZ301_1069 [Bacteroidota bacterium]|jgi:hypothetical protein